MPQLDPLSFISQIIWFLGLFYLFYFCVVRYILVPLARINKIRRLKLFRLTRDVQIHNYGISRLFNKYIGTVSRGLNNELTFFSRYRNQFIRLNFISLLNFIKHLDFFVFELEQFLARREMYRT